MNKPRMNQMGGVDLPSVAGLTYEELQTWVRDRLQGRDLALASEHGDLPHFLIAAIYRDLDRRTRRDLQAIVSEFVRDLAHNPEAEWVGEAGSELLMLADPVLLDVDDRDEIVSDLRKIAGSADSPTSGRPDLRFRALQALVTLHHRADLEYWKKQYQKGGQTYLPVVFEGLSLIDVSVPIRWLKDVPWSRTVERSFIGLLPSLLEDYGAAKVTRILSEVLWDLPKAARDAIVQFCEEEGLTLIVFLSPSQAPLRTR